jgi:hypothetical protein
MNLQPYCIRDRVTSRLAAYRQSVPLGDKPLDYHDHNFFFQIHTCVHSPYVTPSLMRGWVCSLQLLLVLARTFSGPNPAGLAATFYSLRSPYLYPPGREWPSYTPRHWVGFSSPLTTRRLRYSNLVGLYNFFHTESRMCDL